MLYETLTDLLNNDPAAYEYFYALPAEMQTALRQQGSVHSLPQLKEAARRPAAPSPSPGVLKKESCKAALFFHQLN